MNISEKRYLNAIRVRVVCGVALWLYFVLLNQCMDTLQWYLWMFGVEINCSIFIWLAHGRVTAANMIQMYHAVGCAIIVPCIIVYSLTMFTASASCPLRVLLPLAVHLTYEALALCHSCMYFMPPTADECCICLGQMHFYQRILTLPCHHRFHRSCIHRWMARSRDCPLCKRVMIQSRQNGYICMPV